MGILKKVVHYIKVSVRIVMVLDADGVMGMDSGLFMINQKQYQSFWCNQH